MKRDNAQRIEYFHSWLCPLVQYVKLQSKWNAAHYRNFVKLEFGSN